MEAPALAATAGGSIATSTSRSSSLHHQHHQPQHHHQHEPPPPSSSHQPVHKRPRLGASNDSCSTCRLRKIKCPGRPGGEHGVPCEKCAKAGVKCGFVGDSGGKVSRVTPTQDLTEAGTRRKRAQRACEACHSHKTKCSGDFPKCKRCLENNLNCEYKVSRRKFASASAASPSTPLHPTPTPTATATVAPRALPPVVSAEAKQLISPIASSVSPALTDSTRAPSMGSVLISEDILARSDLLLRHFDVWFDSWAKLPLLAVLHPEQTYRGIREKTLNPNIARCICAITTRFIYPNSINMPEFAERCAEDVDQHILKHINSFLNEGDGLDNLVILIITVCYFWIEGSMGKVWMYMGLAGRLITALQLNWEGAGESPVRQEIIRRAVWTIWKLDRYLANGFDEHLVLRDDVMHVRVPTTDQGFPEESNTVMAAASPHTTQPLEKPLCAYLVGLYRMKHLILGITKKLADSPTSHPRMARPETSHFLKQVVQLQARLLHFNQSLPAQLKVSDTTVIERWVNTTDCGSFIMLYTVFWELYVDLYRFSIPGLREEASAEFAKQLPPDFVEKSQKQAVGYAVSLSQFWRAAQEVAASRSWVNGRERLLTVDQTLILHVIQVTKVLLAARQHRLYDNLEELSSAPFVTKEPINDDALMALIQSNLKIFDGFAVFFPVTIETHTRDLRQAVEGIHNNIPYDNPRETIGLPARKAPENIRLPGPHYMLEQAIAPPDIIQHDRQHQNASKADDFLRSKRQSPRRDSLSSSAELSQPGPRPEIPIWLASARMAPPAPSRTQSTPQRSPIGQPPPDGGPGGSHQHLYVRAGSWSAPGPAYNGGSSVSPVPVPPPTNQHNYANPIFGLGGTHDTHPGFYHRAGGKTLPFPDIDSIM